MSLWLAEGPPTAGTASVLPDATEVAIVGGGIAGIATAWHLADAGLQPVVLEAGAVAGRASGRNDGQLLLGLGEHYHRIVGQFGPERARLLWSFLRDNHAHLRTALAADGVDCDLVVAGGLRLAATAHEWQELHTAAALLRAEGHAHELLPPAALTAAFPAAHGFFGALQLHGEAIVQPVRMVRGLAAGAARRGARIVEGARVERLTGTAGDFALHLHDGRSLRAQMVVHCTSTLARELDDSGFLHANVFPFRGQVLATAPLPAATAAAFPPHAMSTNFCYEYFRRHGDRFVIGGMRWSVPGEEVGILDDGTTNPQVTANLRAFVDRHFPVLGGTDFAHVWTGIMAGTPDGLPLVGELPGRPGVFALLAFNGYGLSFAWLAGACLAEMLLQGRTAHPAAPLFAPRRFRA